MMLPFTKIDPDGWIFLGVFIFVTCIANYYSSILSTICILLTVWCLWFFREPSRVPPLATSRLILSPADGTVCQIQHFNKGELNLPVTVNEDYIRVSIFMSVFDVHVNCVPCDGVITHIKYDPGKFFNASLDKASVHNERNCVVMRNSHNDIIAFTQIAGLIARRIRCDVKVQQEVQAGQKMGIIRFGSRVDVYVPARLQLQVRVGQSMISAETVIAQYK